MIIKRSTVLEIIKDEYKAFCLMKKRNEDLKYLSLERKNILTLIGIIDKNIKTYNVDSEDYVEAKYKINLKIEGEKL